MKAAVVILGCLLVLAVTNSIESKSVKVNSREKRAPREEKLNIDDLVNSFARLVARDVNEAGNAFDLGKALAMAKKGMDIVQSLKDRDITAAMTAGKELFADLMAPTKK